MIKHNMEKKALAIIAALCFSSCVTCDEEKKAAEKSPDGKYIATLYARNCGATTPIVYHVNIQPSQKWSVPGFGGDEREGEVFAIDRMPVSLVWKDNKTLVIECDKCPPDQPVRLVKTWEDVSVSYQPSQKIN